MSWIKINSLEMSRGSVGSERAGWLLTAQWVPPASTMGRGAGCKGDQSSCVWPFNVRYNNVSVADTGVVTARCCGPGRVGNRRRERVRDGAEAAQHTISFKASGHPHRGSGHWIQSAEGPGTDQGSTQRWHRPGLGDSTDPYIPQSQPGSPLITVPREQEPGRFLSFSKSHSLS